MAVPNFNTLRHIAEHFNTSVEYLIGNIDARNIKNQIVVNDLKLSDKSIKIIQQLTNQKVSYLDNRLLIDVLNAIIELPDFSKLIHAIGCLTNPFIRDWPEYYPADLRGYDAIALKLYCKFKVHQHVDNIVEELRNQYKQNKGE